MNMPSNDMPKDVFEKQEWVPEETLDEISSSRGMMRSLDMGKKSFPSFPGKVVLNSDAAISIVRELKWIAEWTPQGAPQWPPNEIFKMPASRTVKERRHMGENNSHTDTTAPDNETGVSLLERV